MRAQPPGPSPTPSLSPTPLAEPAREPGLFAATLQALLEPPAPAADLPPDEEEELPSAESSGEEKEMPVEGLDAAPEPSSSSLPFVTAPGPGPELEHAPLASRLPAAPREPAVEAMLRQVQVVSAPDTGAGLHLELETPRCARLGLDLRLERGRIEASLVASTREDQALLRAGVAELEAGLIARGLTVGSLRVELRGEEGAARDRQRPRSPAPRPRDPRESRRRRGGGEFVV